MLRKINPVRGRPAKGTATTALGRSASNGVKALALASLCGILLVLAFPPYSISYFAWFAFIPLFFALDKKNRKTAFFLAYLSGAIFFSGLLHWVHYVSLLGTVFLVLYLALFFGLFGLLFQLSNKRFGVILIPTFWVGLEFLRAHLFSGFPWSPLAYSQSEVLPVIQLADITGPRGISFLLVMINFALFLTLKRRASLRTFLFALGVLGGVLTYGFFRLDYITRKTRAAPAVFVTVIQPNIFQGQKWNPAFQEVNFEKLLLLSELASREEPSPELVVWPETAVTFFPEEEPMLFERLRNLPAEIGCPLLTGNFFSKGDSFFNSATLLWPEPKPAVSYDKLHLVPFGEYYPWEGIIPRFGPLRTAGGLSRGDDFTIFTLPEDVSKPPLSFAVLICFEDIFPALSRRFVRKGAKLLINITNDAWFGRTGAPYQHAQASVFRAVENRVSVVRSTNTGLSCFIDPTGRVTSRVQNRVGEDIFTTGYLTEKVSIINLPTFYTRFGDWFAYLCLLISLISIIFLRKS